jgi:hypothetical protein
MSEARTNGVHRAPKYRLSRYITTEVEVDIADYLTEVDDEELAELGLRRTDPLAVANEDFSDLYSALDALHQQAHPDQPLFIDTCLREPCRSLSLRKFPALSRRA